MTPESSFYTLPLLPLKEAVVYPNLALPLALQGTAAVQAVESALATADKRVALFTRRGLLDGNSIEQDLFPLGTAANVQIMTKTETTMQIIAYGLERIEFIKLMQSRPFPKAQVRSAPQVTGYGLEKEALLREFLELTGQYFTLYHPEKKINFPATVKPGEDIMQLVYPVAKLLQLNPRQEQQLLETDQDLEAIKIVIGYLNREIQVQEIRKKVSDKAKDKLNEENRKYLLREQIRALQQELGEEAPDQQAAELNKKLARCKLPDTVRPEVEKEMARLNQIPTISPEYQVALSHMELILDLPWDKTSPDNLNLAHARQVLDEDHYSLQEVKERILEHLAVMILNPRAKSPILCFVGPPGVGKTSLGQSIARALGRQFERFSLGTLHDEAELRGHRRTYIGAMPGRLIQAIRRAEVKNPLIMLDEIDKLGRDVRGDPAAALMEILDPAQNNSFHDNYLDLPFDLSKVFFVTTANTLDQIPRPLLDRMETLRLPGYSDEEKAEIARRYLFPRLREDAGLRPEQLGITAAALKEIIHRYTREAGVRELERMLGRLARKTAVRFAQGETTPVMVDVPELLELLGPERFFAEQLRQTLAPGVAIGMAWTEAGGDILYIEAIKLNKGERITLTGQLGEVMKESAMTAASYISSRYRERAGQESIDAPLHIHIPAGAIPKDGPSAGVTMAAALASLYLEQPVRSDSAMTGEITLSGLVLPVGGIKEKILAARRAGIYRIILPSENQKDLHDLPAHVLAEMEFIYVAQIEDALEAVIPALQATAPSH